MYRKEPNVIVRTLYIISQCIVHGLGWHYQSLFHWIQWTSFPNIRKEGEFGAVLNVKTVSLNVYEKVFMELEFIHWKLRWHGVAFVFWKRNSKKRFRIFSPLLWSKFKIRFFKVLFHFCGANSRFGFSKFCSTFVK